MRFFLNLRGVRKIFTIVKLFAGIILGTVLGLAGFFLIGKLIFQNFYQPYVVLSGSMEPAIPTGAVVLVKPQPQYSVGDVVTFKIGASDLVTHRIANIENDLFITKGDANEDPDSGSISKSQIIGKLAFSVPYLGYLIEWSKTPQGFIALVIIPATIIVYEELRSMHFELKKLLSKLFSRKTKPEPIMNETGEPKPIPKGISKAYAIIPLLGCAFLIVTATAAYFADAEKNQNSFSAATTFPQQLQQTLGLQSDELSFSPPPIPNLATHLVINEIFATPNAFQTLGNKYASQWVEIYNPTGNTIDLSTYSIREGANCDEFLGGLELPGGGYAVLTPAPQEQFNTIWQMPDNAVFVPITETIGNGIEATDELILSSIGCDATSDNLDQIEVVATDEGQSYKRAIDGVDTDSDSDFVLTAEPKPGL